jgi:acyl carrier protein
MTAEPGSIKAVIRQFVMDSAQGKGVKEIGDNDSLTESGVIDSLGIFRLVSFLEENVGVHIGDDEILQDNFRSIADIERFVAAKLASQGEKAGSIQ